MRDFEYLHHTDLLILLQALNHGGGRFRPLAGGTDLVPLIKRGIEEPDAVLDITRLEQLRAVHEVPGSGLLIGSLVTLSEVAADARLRGRYAALAKAAAAVATPQIRNVATIGGNLLQRPQCPYFRGTAHCWLKGGDDCPAREGESQLAGIFEDSPCVAAHPSDIATALVALEAAIHVQSAWTERSWPMRRFMRPPFPEYRDETVLTYSELLTFVQLPEPPEGLRSVYVREPAPERWSFPLVNVALAAVIEADQLRDVRLALGGVATVPRRVAAAESILAGGPIDSVRVEQAIIATLEGARPLSRNAYKLPLLQGAIRQAVEQILH